VPTYLYEILDKKNRPTGETFEIVQLMKDEPLTKEPGTDRPCRRAIVAPAIAGKWSPIKAKSTLSNKNLERMGFTKYGMGFTKYERRGNGYMEKTAGKGPRAISAED